MSSLQAAAAKDTATDEEIANLNRLGADLERDVQEGAELMGSTGMDLGGNSWDDEDDEDEDEYMEDAKKGKRYTRSIDVIEEKTEAQGDKRSKRGWFK